MKRPKTTKTIKTLRIPSPSRLYNAAFKVYDQSDSEIDCACALILCKVLHQVIEQEMLSHDGSNDELSFEELRSMVGASIINHIAECIEDRGV